MPMKTKNEWLQSVYQPAAQKFPERKYNFKNLSDMDPEPIYTADDLGDWDAERDLGYPGEFPYTRGVQSSVYRGKLWTMRMFAGFGSAEQTNARFHSLLGAGQTGLSTAFDLPTLMGYDSDHPFSKGEVGKCGVAVSSLADMEILFQGIDPTAVTTSMTINSPANAVWAMYIANAQKQGKDLRKVGGTIQNDILKEFIAQKEFIYPPSPSVKLVIDTFEWGPKVLPKWNFISVSGYHIREAGATGVQELAFTLADGFHYVEKALERGLDIDEFAPRISFFWDIHNDFFEEIAKMRAARRIWARQMRDRYGAKNPRSLMLRTHSQTAGVSLPAQQPLNNIARDQARIEIYNSLLSEAGVLGFEYGYTLADPRTLVMWEAQFGDFANGAQVIIDQFLASGESKWLRMSGLTLLLPHGYEGQGPEHSSARIERFLTLAADDAMTVAQPSTPASYFHLLRKQSLESEHRPLVVFTPKSMLRSKAAASQPEDFTSGRWEPVLGDRTIETRHVALGILRAECPGRELLESAGVDVRALRAALQEPRAKSA